MRFLDLHPTWIDERHHFLEFDCPVCRKHRLPIHIFPRWTIDDPDDFTRITIRPSINVTPGDNQCAWHGFITSGDVSTV